MPGCLTLLRFWRKRKQDDEAATVQVKEKYGTFDRPQIANSKKTSTDSSFDDPLKNSKTKVQVSYMPHPTCNPIYSAYAAPKDLAWINATQTRPVSGHTDETEETARRRKTEEEEQERLNFFQML
ncbi:uncharacterized protein CTHT_0031780 [Thermochaetoides thermophila DSM 1495]|uniref:Uncharacterized protein n=1 Tax=Chaetomium thermophilum (strain DSM 1495 / CBS 144.50 / IMI 039719) TaxID=759272 RepID=G0S4V2_CHATD|nr:hypothetical protein CTHT_0031780 [Thermochaetoides thermophila DSM 1495]EGS21323.1 hypothetical protein CTHT_0031780 [Thermochaetoides thermophila DSM 1495]